MDESSPTQSTPNKRLNSKETPFSPKQKHGKKKEDLLNASSNALSPIKQPQNHSTKQTTKKKLSSPNDVESEFSPPEKNTKKM